MSARKQPSPPTYIRAIVAMADGPTDEQKRKSAYRRAASLPGVDRATIHECENRLRELEYIGVLSARQREAGEKFEADYWTCLPSTMPRDSLNLSRGDGHESEAQAKRAKDAAARVRSVRARAGAWYPALRSLCVFRERVKLAAVVLPSILDFTAEVYGLK